MKRSFFFLLCLFLLYPIFTTGVHAENDYTITYETGDPYAITYSFGDDYFIWNDPPDYCQWDANRWIADKWGGNWQEMPLADSGSLIGDVSCTIFSTCDALSVLAGIYIDPGQEAVKAYEQGVMSKWGVDYTAALYLADQYAIPAEKISYEDLAEALQNGKPVVAFTHGSVFSAGDHAICLFGYQDGKTFVRDPSHPERWQEDDVGGKWYDLSYIDEYNPNGAYVAFGLGLDRSQIMDPADLKAAQSPQQNQKEKGTAYKKSSSASRKAMLIERTKPRLADFRKVLTFQLT